MSANHARAGIILESSNGANRKTQLADLFLPTQHNENNINLSTECTNKIK